MTIFVVVTIQKNIMAKKKKAVKTKEPIRLRFKELANGNKSLYLDIYRDGKRQYEFLKLYLIPETDETAKARNLNTLQAASYRLLMQELEAFVDALFEHIHLENNLLFPRFEEVERKIVF